MKKIFIILIALLLLTTMLVGCNEPQETSNEPIPEMFLNYDILTDLGLTFGEIEAERGDYTIIPPISKYATAPKFTFENGFGEYSFTNIIRESYSYGAEFHILSDYFLRSIDGIRAGDLFLGMPQVLRFDALGQTFDFGPYVGNFHFNIDFNGMILQIFIHGAGTYAITDETTLSVSVEPNSWREFAMANLCQEPATIPKITLNYDLLSDLGQPLSVIIERRGQPVNPTPHGTEITHNFEAYMLETRSGVHHFFSEWRAPNGETYMLNDFLLGAIHGQQIENIFPDLTDPGTFLQELWDGAYERYSNIFRADNGNFVIKFGDITVELVTTNISYSVILSDESWHQLVVRNLAE